MGEKVQLVQTHRKRYGLNRCCEAVDLSKGTWRRRQQGGSRPEDQALKAQLRPILREHPDYGYRRIVVELAARLGEPVNHKRVKRILRDNHWSLVRQLPRYRPSVECNGSCRSAPASWIWCEDGSLVSCKQ